MERDLKQVLLPASGITAHLAAELLFGEYRKIEALVYSGVSAEAGQDGGFNAKFDGNAIARQETIKFLTWVKRLVAKDGTEMPVNEASIDGLPIKDGLLLKKEIEKLDNASKKNS